MVQVDDNIYTVTVSVRVIALTPEQALSKTSIALRDHMVVHSDVHYWDAAKNHYHGPWSDREASSDNVQPWVRKAMTEMAEGSSQEGKD